MKLFAFFLLAAAAQAPAEPRPDAAVTVATVAIADDRTAVELVSRSEDRLFVRARGPDGSEAYETELASVRDALAVLADRKLAALWPAVTDFAGRDLERQRVRFLARTELRGVGDDPSLRARRRFDAMAQVGRLDEGLAEVRAVLAANADKNRLVGTAVLRAEVASELAGRGRVGEALALLDSGEKSRRAVKRLRGAYSAERAAILAEAGRHAEALRWVDSARRQALKVDRDADADPRFSWVRACALAGLGRAEEAMTEYGRVEAASEAPVRLRLRALACMGDTERLAAELVRQLESEEMPSKVALMLRMAEVSPHPWARPFARAAGRPDVRAALDARSRSLPMEMVPALRGWVPNAR